METWQKMKNSYVSDYLIHIFLLDWLYTNKRTKNVGIYLEKCRHFVSPKTLLFFRVKVRVKVRLRLGLELGLGTRVRVELRLE